MAGINLSLRRTDAILLYSSLRSWLKPGEIMPWDKDIEEALRDVAVRLRDKLVR